MRASARTLTLVGATLAVLSLGLPWRSVVGMPSDLTPGHYTASSDYDAFGTSVCETSFAPGGLVPGLPAGSYTGADSVARFFIVAAVTLALVGGLYLGRSRPLQWAAYAGVAGILLYVYYGLVGGTLAMGAACACFWLAARRTPERDQVAVGVTG